MEDGNVRFSMKTKGQNSRIAFCMNIAQLFILSDLTTPWIMLPFKNTRFLICFCSTIDENTDSVHLIEGFVFQWNSHTLGSGMRITAWYILSMHLILEKKQEKLKTQDRDVSYKFKSKLVVIRRNIQHFTGTVL